MPSVTLIDAASRTMMADKPKRTKWMKSAVPPDRKGVFSSKAKAAGKSTTEFAAEKKDAPGTLGKQARLAETFAKERPKKKPLAYSNSKY